MGYERMPYLPHRDFLVAEEEDVNLLLHVGWLLHVHVVVEEVLNRSNESERLQLLTVGEFVLTGLNSTVLFRHLRTLVVPELPVAMDRVLWLAF